MQNIWIVWRSNIIESLKHRSVFYTVRLLRDYPNVTFLQRFYSHQRFFSFTIMLLYLSHTLETVMITISVCRTYICSLYIKRIFPSGAVKLKVLWIHSAKKYFAPLTTYFDLLWKEEVLEVYMNSQFALSRFQFCYLGIAQLFKSENGLPETQKRQWGSRFLQFQNSYFISIFIVLWHI